METPYHSSVSIPAGKVTLNGEMILPYEAKGIVIFVHGSGSSRFHPRHNKMARLLRDHGYGTLLPDLLTDEEDDQFFSRFDIDLLTSRLVDVTNWVMEQGMTKYLPVAYFSVNTGSACALCAAAEIGRPIRAVVSRGGHPDLAKDCLPRVKSPVLLIVGSLDTQGLKFNQEAFMKIASGTKELDIIDGASHLFEETGMLEKVAEKTAAWYDMYVAEPVLG